MKKIISSIVMILIASPVFGQQLDKDAIAVAMS